MLRPVPEFIAAVIPITRSSRRHSSTSALPNTCVYCGAGVLAKRDLRTGATRRVGGDRLGLGGMPLLHSLQPALLSRRKALALDRRAVHDDRALGLERLAQRAAQRPDVVAVDHAHVGEVELLPPEPGRPERLDRLLEVRAEALERGADSGRQLREPVLDVLAGVPQLRVQPDAVEVARQRTDVGRDRHPVVVEHARRSGCRRRRPGVRPRTRRRRSSRRRRRPRRRGRPGRDRGASPP